MQPYLWVFNDNIEKHKEEILKIKDEEQNVYVTKIEIQEKHYLGKKVNALKVFYNNPKKVNYIFFEQ